MSINYELNNKFILGEGKMTDDPVDYELKNMANNSAFKDDIIFTGKVDDVYNYLQLLPPNTHLSCLLIDICFVVSFM